MRLGSIGAALLLGARALAAQTVIGGSVQGTVTAVGGDAVEEATVLATNRATGERWQVQTRSGGRFAIDHLAVGGQYRVEVHALGFASAERSGVSLSQGQRVWLDFHLTPAALTLQELTVRGRANSELDAGRTGPSLTIPDSTIARLPLAIRDFSRLALLSPLVTPGPTPSVDGGVSFAGQHTVFNSILVDGTTYNSLRGGEPDGFAGIPGTQNEFGFFAIVPEAIQEIQVMTAPYDVRYGNFTGGLISAVTRSGTNQWHGSLYGNLESPSLAGHNPDGTRLDPFTRQELGVTLGGPIARDRIAFFLQGSVNRNRFPHTTASPSATTPSEIDTAVGVSYASATRFRDVLANTYGLDAGSFAGIDRTVGIGKVFAKVTAQLGVNSRLEVSQSYLHESPRLEDEHIPGAIAFSSGGAYDPNTLDATRVEWTTAFAARWTNQARLGYRRETHRCVPNAGFARVTAQVDGEAALDAGQQRGCAGADNLEAVWEATDNLELAAGPHHFTFGTHNELVRTADAGGIDAGQWFFSSLDSLEQRLPSHYERILFGPDSPADATTRVRVTQLGFYVQDQWTPNSRLTVTGGVRVDLPLLTDKPKENLLLLSELGISSATTPSGRLLWSPRVGVNYDLSGRGTAFIRGGIGFFSGQPAYSWLRNAYSDIGSVGLTFLNCEGEQLPDLTLDPSSQPSACADASLPRPLLTVFDPRFRFPRDLKLSLGGDVALPWGLIGTTDLLFTAGINQFAQRDLNLGPPVGVAAGEGGRVLYGTFDPDGNSIPNHLSSSFDAVTQMTNESGNRAYTMALQLRKRLGKVGEVLAAYTYTYAKDRTDLPGQSGRGNLGLSVLDGTWEHPELSTALWSRPHKVTLFGTAALPLGLELGLAYIGVSGTPFTYIVDGDANADGFDNPGQGRLNDAAYVPRNADDITLADGESFEKLDSYIESDPCLRSQRGRLLRRNSCRNPWSGRLDLRLGEMLPKVRGQSLELVADVFNVLNLLDNDWGRVRNTVAEFGAAELGNRVALLTLAGYDAARERGVYTLRAPLRQEVDVDATRWRVRLSLHYQL